MATSKPVSNPSAATERRWAAVLARDASQDGRFVYAVASTGIYCRPSCPSKRPGRAQVRFYAGPSAAEAAGYRACRRCNPAAAGPAPAARRVLHARAYLDRHPEATITLAALARMVGLSPYHLQRSFKRLTGLSPRAYTSARRLGRLKEHLRMGTTVSQATYDAGYGSASRVYDTAANQLGMTPATYRRGGRGARIRYTVTSIPLGQLLVAATDRGLCAAALGDDPDALAHDLRREFPHADLTRADTDRELAVWTAEIAKLATGTDAAKLPLDIPGTPFQWKVWDRLRRIPRGTTRSYQAIAADLGQPTAARAVARACATNPVALAIPCHRVVRGDGELGGYRWGIERKRWLLARERASETPDG